MQAAKLNTILDIISNYANKTIHLDVRPTIFYFFLVFSRKSINIYNKNLWY